MELYHLRTFVKVADAGNLTRASALLHTSQPAISAQIKALEEELEVQLFVRSARGMELTAAGKQLYQDAEQTLAAADSLKERAQAMRKQVVGEIRLGINTDPDFLQIGELFDGLREQHSQLDIHILQSSSATVIGELRRGEADAGFLFGDCDAPDVNWIRLAEIPMGLVLPRTHAELAGADIAELCRLPWIYSTQDCPFYKISEALFERVDQRPKSLAWVNTEDTVRSLAGSGAGVAMMRLDDAQNLQRQGRGVVWQGEAGSLDLGFVCLAKRAQERPLMVLTELVESLFAVPRRTRSLAAS